ncbi:MAG: hypothetical protein ACSHWW_12725 [Nonlabens sp.]|uniref:hypothetical protein n=1 Tax=Nonlabens sp. TaxID=1888209 RepID=UPI003EF954F0
MSNIQPSIKSPCHFKWEELQETKNAQERFCATCSNCVHDITELNASQITELYHSKNGDLCIKASTTQLKNSYSSNIPLYRKVGAALAISFLSLTSFNARAQTDSRADTVDDLEYTLTAKDSKDSQITIKGRIKLTDYLGDKASSETIILRIFTRTANSVRQVKEIQLSKRGTFKFKIEKALLNEDFFISISEPEYLDEPIILDHLPVKDIQLKATLDKERRIFMVGRFF